MLRIHKIEDAAIMLTVTVSPFLVIPACVVLPAHMELRTVGLCVRGEVSLPTTSTTHFAAAAAARVASIPTAASFRFHPPGGPLPKKCLKVHK